MFMKTCDMKILNTVCGMVLLVQVSAMAGAQVKPAAMAPAKVKPAAVNRAPVDTFVRNITVAVKQVMAIAVNPKKSMQHLATLFIGSAPYGTPRYQSAVNINGAEKSLLEKIATNRAKGICFWEWTSVIFSAPKGIMADQLNEAKKNLDSLLKTIAPLAETDEKNHVITLEVIGYINDPKAQHDSLLIKISFTKPVLTTAQQVIDSLLEMYKDGLYNESTAKDATTKFSQALDNEGIQGSSIQEVFTVLINKVAGSNIKAAFKILMNVPWNVDYVKIKDSLPDDQRQEIKKMAQKVVSDYNAQWDAKPVAPAAVTTKSREEAECDTKLSSLLFAIGAAITYERFSSYPNAIIMDYDCKQDKYLVIERAAKDGDGNSYTYKDRTEFEKYSTCGWNYTICYLCHGEGIIHGQYEKAGSWSQWEKVAAYNYVSKYNSGYTVQTKEKCKLCKGVGFRR